MPRWYKGFNSYGKPSNVVDNIRNIVQWHNLGSVIPVVRVEKQAKRGRFLLFLAIESPVVGEVPESVRGTLLRLPALKTPFPNPFDYEEIRSIVGAELDVHNYAHSIPYPYKRLDSQQIENPFDIIEKTPEINDNGDDIIIRTQHYDRLMLWISAIGSGSWNMFRTACQTLSLDEDGSRSRSILRRLRVLGHIESSYSGDRWSVAPSVLVHLNNSDEGDEYLLCGQRTTLMLQALRKFADVHEYPQNGSGPAVIRIWLKKVEQVSALFKEITSAYQSKVTKNVAYQLAQLLPSLNDWMNTLEKLEGIVPYIYTLKRFNGVSFTEEVFTEKSGFYEFWPLEKNFVLNRPLYTLFYDTTGSRWLRGDWYGLRFLSLQLQDNPCPVHYDPISKRLAIPQIWHWPELYERSLILASGQLPMQNRSWLIYEAVEPELLDLLSSKMKLSREDTELYV